MKKLMLTMLSVVGMMLFVALPAKACTSYYVGKDCTKDGTTMYGRTEDYSPKKDKVYKVIQPKKVGKNATFKDAVTVKGQKTDISVNLEPIQKVFLCLLLHLHL